MRWLGVIAALVLSACAFSSEYPFFAESEGAHLFGDGETLTWRERPTGEAFQVRFERVGGSYDFHRLGENEAPMRAMFAPIAETPEQDYIAQVILDSEGSSGVAYAFVWRAGRTYRVFLDPRAIEESPQGLCRSASYGECQFDRRDDVLRYYREVIYPAFVRGERRPTSYLDLEPSFPDDGAGRPVKTR